MTGMRCYQPAGLWPQRPTRFTDIIPTRTADRRRLGTATTYCSRIRHWALTTAALRRITARLQLFKVRSVLEKSLKMFEIRTKSSRPLKVLLKTDEVVETA